MKTEEHYQTQPTLIFIPDISGFTRFVRTNEIRHSQHIIEELLDVLIDANDIGLEVSEIEGDAILFFRQGVQPTAAELLAQVQRMYVQFHAHLKKYSALRICQCGACSTADSLAIKFIIHYGDLSKKSVKDFSKLFGIDIITAHRLMKNEIRLKEYVLVTHQLLNACSAWVEMQQVAWEEVSEGEDFYDGEKVKYCYLSLAPLAIHVPEPRIEDFSLRGATKQVLSVEGLVHAPLDLVFDVVSDVTFRHHWVSGLTASGENNGKITKHGSTHRCVMQGTDKDPFMISHTFSAQEDLIIWVETDHKAKWDIIIRLKRVGDALTQISYTFMIRPGIIGQLQFSLLAKRMLNNWLSGNFKTLDKHCSALAISGQQHLEHIELAGLAN